MTWLAADSAVTSPWFTGLVALILGVGGGGGIVALFKVKPERGRIVIDAAQGAVVVQSGVMDELRKELDRLKEELDELRSDRDAEVNRLRAEVVELRSGRDAEVAQLRAEVARLRAENAVTATRVTRVEQAGDGPPAGTV